MTLFAGRNASSDTSCGFTGPGDVEGVALALGPLSLIDDTLAHWPLAGSPVIDGADASECLTDDQRGAARPIDGDESGTPECDLGAIEVPEPGFSVLFSSGILGLCVLARKRRRGSC